MRASCEALVAEKARVEAGVRRADDAGRRRNDIFGRRIGVRLCGEERIGWCGCLVVFVRVCGSGGICLMVAVRVAVVQRYKLRLAVAHCTCQDFTPGIYQINLMAMSCAVSRVEFCNM
jgi:hypothetical protein